MSKNVILTDKNGNQIAPATTATQAKYDDNNTVKDKIDELNERIDNLVTGNVIPLTITANGVYPAPEGVDGFNPVTANVSPSKVLISDFDFKSASHYYDKVKYINLSTNMRAFTYALDVGLTCTNRNTRLRTGTNFDYAGVYEVKIKFGNFDRTTAPTGYTNSVLFKVGRNSGAFMLCFNYNSSTQEGRWWIHDQTGNNIYLDGITDPYYFENKTLTVTYGAKYENGELVRDASKGYFYVDGVQLHQNGASLTGDVDSQIQTVFLGDAGSNSYLGAVYESFKVYQYFDKYETPVTLLGFNPTEETTEQELTEETQEEVEEQQR